VYALLYVYQGVVLVVSLLSPTKRKQPLERWKNTKSHKLVYEIGFGIIGLMILAVPVFYLLLIILAVVLGITKSALSN